MRLKLKYILSALFLWIFSLHAQEFRSLPNSSFHFGEVLKFRVHYGMITAGEAVLEIDKEPVQMEGRECYHIVGTGTSARSFDWFYKVRDRYETYVDTKGLFPWYFKRRIEEGDFNFYTEVKFDQVNRKAFERGKVFQVPEYIHDVISAFYYARTVDFANFKPGDVFTVQNFIDEKISALKVRFIGRETVKCELGTFRAVKLEPLVEEGGIFMHKGKLFLWISDDSNRIPLLIESGLVIGSIKINLKHASGLRNPMSSRIK